MQETAATFVPSSEAIHHHAVRGELDSVLVRHQGDAANLSVSDTDNTARALSASLRIPAPRLAAALGELKSLGRVTGEAQAGEEVKSQHADLVARIKNSRETEIRLQDILRNRTGKVAPHATRLRVSNLKGLRAFVAQPILAVRFS